MKNNDAFSEYHPVVNFIYFGLVLIFSMVFMHPVCLLISLVSALIYSFYLSGKKAIRFNLIYMLPIMVVTAIINPAFNHEGSTILTHLPNDNPLTLESIVYGIAAAVMLISVINWFSCYNSVMTSDKFIYLFGRIIPSLSLVLSMTLCFIPKFKTRIKAVSNARFCIGKYVTNKSIIQRVKNGLTILSVMVTWSFENAIETADSMISRGYGLSGRTTFSIYRFERRDFNMLVLLLVSAAYIIVGYLGNAIYFRYFPIIKGIGAGIYQLSVFMVYLFLCITPVIINLREDIKWIHLQSKI